MKSTEFKTWVRRQLGYDEDCTSVNVEVSDRQIEQGLSNASRWFNSFVGTYREGAFSLVPGQSEYDLASIRPRVGSVVKAYFPAPSSRIDFGVLYPGFLDVNGIPYGLGGMEAYGSWGSNSYPQTSLVQTMQTLSSNERLYSSDLDWRFMKDLSSDPVRRIIRIMPAPVSQVGNCIFLYAIEPEDIKLEWYDSRMSYFLTQWALADVKMILGRKRSKFSSVSTAGGDKQLDGESLINEGKEEKLAIEQQILEIQGHPSPMVY